MQHQQHQHAAAAPRRDSLVTRFWTAGCAFLRQAAPSRCRADAAPTRGVRRVQQVCAALSAPCSVSPAAHARSALLPLESLSIRCSQASARCAAPMQKRHKRRSLLYSSVVPRGCANERLAAAADAALHCCWRRDSDTAAESSCHPSASRRVGSPVRPYVLAAVAPAAAGRHIPSRSWTITCHTYSEPLLAWAPSRREGGQQGTAVRSAASPAPVGSARDDPDPPAAVGTPQPRAIAAGRRRAISHSAARHARVTGTLDGGGLHSDHGGKAAQKRCLGGGGG